MKREQMELARLRRNVGEVLRRDRQETIDEPWQTPPPLAVRLAG
jgi:hypothetical protein